jgi:uncharacterized repeat protein (TIGR02543 family)
MYARWRSEDEEPAEDYTITFNSRGGSALTAISADEGTKIGKPGDPEKTGYVFTGWFSAVKGGEFYSWPHELASDVTMYAQWRAWGEAPPNYYTITFKSQGGTTVAAVTAASGTGLKKPADPKRRNYIFLGWYSAASGGTAYEWPLELSESITVYAQWQNEDEYTITFDSQGGSETSAASGNAGDQIEQPSNPSRPGYIFQGWYSAASGGTKYEGPITLAGDLTLYAQWSGTAYTVEYDGNGADGGSVTPTQHIYGAESSLAENGFARAGYIFAGWNTQAGGLGFNYAALGKVTDLTREAGETVKLYARWNSGADSVYTISFESPGGEPAASIAANAGDQVGQPGNPVRDAYTFEGWYSAESGGMKYNWPYTLTGNVTMYAQWTPVSCTITYNLNGGINTAGNPLSYTVESAAITLADPVRAGYGFDGWYDNASHNGSAVSSIPQGSAGDKTFWAKWEGLGYTVALDPNGGSGGSAVVTAVFGSAMPTGADITGPTKANYKFGGYYDKAGTSGTPYYTKAMASARDWDKTGPATLYAKWTPVAYTINYNLSGGTNPEANPAAYTVESGEITLASPVRTNYVFDNWYANPDFSGNPVASITADTAGNKTFYAKWTAAYTVTYDNNEGSGSTEPSIHKIGESNDLAANGFTKDGYVFSGWNTRSDGGGTTYKAGKPAANLKNAAGEEITLYARWLPASMTIELDKPERTIGRDAAGNVRWQFFPERKEYVVYSGFEYKNGKMPIYVTGRTQVNNIRIVPGKSENQWSKVPNYSGSGAYKKENWDDYNLDGLTYSGKGKIPEIKLLGPVYNAHQIHIIFVNAEIDIPNTPGVNPRPPLDIGPYHMEWDDSSIFEGEFYGSKLGASYYNDHEIDAVVEFEGENTLYTPYRPSITLWDSREEGRQYVNEIPWQPDSDSYDSWDAKENKPHWEKYRAKCIRFVKKWGYWEYDGMRARLNGLGWGPSYLIVKFRGGGGFIGSGGETSDIVEVRAAADILFPASTPDMYWGRRMRQQSEYPPPNGETS